MADRLDGCGQMEKEKEPGDEFAFCEDYKRFLDCAKTERPITLFQELFLKMTRYSANGFLPKKYR